MAYVKQGAIKTTLIKVLNYAANPSKTENKALVTGINCSNFPLLAYKQMQTTKEKFKKTDKILGQHFKQSFKPGEINDPALAHKIGVKWAEKITDGKYECFVATHIDKDHIHNHIIINSVSKETGEKYNACKEQLRYIRQESDVFCNEYNLSIIESKKDINIEKGNDYKNLSAVKNMSYNIWMIKNNIEDNRTSTRKYVTTKIDEILATGKVKTIDELAEKLNEYKIETRYKSKKGELYKNISFKVIGSSQEKGFRGKYNHSIENLIKRINEPELEVNKIIKNEWQKYANENYPRANYKEFIKQAIDNTINSGECKNIDDLANVLKEKYNISMDYLTKDFRVKKRIKFFANDCPYEKYAVGSYGLAGKDNSYLYENDGIYDRIESSKTDIKEKTAVKPEKSLVKFTGELRQDLELLKAYFEYNNDTRITTVERCINCVDKANIKDIDKLVMYSNANANLAEKEITEKNNKLELLNMINDKECNLEKLKVNRDLIDDKIIKLSAGLGKIKNRNEIKEYKDDISKIDVEIEELSTEINRFNKQNIIDEVSKLEKSISSRKHLQENFRDTVDLFNNKEILTKESNKESKIKQADRLIDEAERNIREQEEK